MGDESTFPVIWLILVGHELVQQMSVAHGRAPPEGEHGISVAIRRQHRCTGTLEKLYSASNKGSAVGLAVVHAVAEATLHFHLEVSIEFAIAVQIAIAFKMEGIMNAIVNMGFGMVTALGTPKKVDCSNVGFGKRV